MKFGIWICVCFTIFMTSQSYAEPISEGDDILIPSKRSTRVVISESCRYRVGYLGLVAINNVSDVIKQRVEELLVRNLGSDLLEIHPVDLPSEIEKQKGSVFVDMRQWLNLGQNALSRFQLSEAEQFFGKIINQFEKNAAHIDDFALLKEAYVNTAEVFHRQKKEDEAKRVLERLVVLDPTYSPDKELYPSSFIRHYTQIHQAQTKLNRSAIHIGNMPPGALIYLDQKQVGVGPVEIVDVLAGHHWIKIKAPGYQPFGARVEIKPGAQVTIEPNLLDDNELFAKKNIQSNRMLDESSRHKIAEFAGKRGLDGMVIAALAGSSSRVSIVLIGVESKTGNAVRLPEIEFDAGLLNAKPEVDHLSLQLANAFREHQFSSHVETGSLLINASMISTPVASRIKFSDLTAVNEAPEAQPVEARSQSKANKRVVLALSSPAGQAVKEEIIETDSGRPGWFWPTIVGGSIGLLAAGGAALGGALYFSSPASANVRVHFSE